MSAPVPQTQPQKPQMSGPVSLAFELYDGALVQFKGNAREASLNVMMFLTEALVFTVGLTGGASESMIKMLLQNLGPQISNAPIPPLMALVESAMSARVIESLTMKK